MRRTTEQLVAGFIDLTLPKAEWTHEAHFRVALWHLLRYSPAETLERLRAGISRYNQAVGGINSDTMGYHETITRFYVWAVARFLDTADRSTPIDELEAALYSAVGDKSLPERYWSKPRLDSVAARRGWLGPDLHPLEPALAGVTDTGPAAGHERNPAADSEEP